MSLPSASHTARWHAPPGSPDYGGYDVQVTRAPSGVKIGLMTDPTASPTSLGASSTASSLEPTPKSAGRRLKTYATSSGTDSLFGSSSSTGSNVQQGAGSYIDGVMQRQGRRLGELVANAQDDTLDLFRWG